MLQTYINPKEFKAPDGHCGQSDLISIARTQIV